MSILQDYEMARRKIGNKKYDAIEIYLKEICPESNWKQYKTELKKINHLEINEWEKEKKKLEEKFGIVWLDDILYKEEGWNKFGKWYKQYKNKKERGAR